jgi:hypothetical protein
MHLHGWLNPPAVIKIHVQSSIGFVMAFASVMLNKYCNEYVGTDLTSVFRKCFYLQYEGVPVSFEEDI